MKIPMKVPMKMPMTAPTTTLAPVRRSNDDDDDGLLGVSRSSPAPSQRPAAAAPRAVRPAAPRVKRPRTPSVSSEPEEEKKVTLLTIALEHGLVDMSLLETEVEEEAPVTVPPPRPPIIRSFPSDIDRALERYRERLNREENTIKMKDDNKTVSLGTSKINYIDPRIVCSWATANSVPINKIFSATIIKKFPWAMNATNFDF